MVFCDVIDPESPYGERFGDSTLDDPPADTFSGLWDGNGNRCGTQSFEEIMLDFTGSSDFLASSHLSRGICWHLGQ